MLFHRQTLGVSDEKGEQGIQALGVTYCNSFQGSQKTSYSPTRFSSSAQASHDVSLCLLAWTPQLGSSLLAHELE